ncbi:MAG TPA: hypothetical protein VI728_12235, partial [Syntrophales bacterium]|nr:hypothetical protein [Syntrophales bacterium]
RRGEYEELPEGIIVQPVSSTSARGRQSPTVFIYFLSGRSADVRLAEPPPRDSFSSTRSRYSGNISRLTGLRRLILNFISL